MGIPLRILIVEDLENDALLSVRTLERGGYEVVFERVQTADAMADALAKRRWDIVLADYTMPHFSGAEALLLVNERHPGLPFIFVSGTIGEDVAVEAMKEGADDYILKGNLKRLVPAVERALREAEAKRERRRMEEQLEASRQTLAALNNILLASLQPLPLEKILDRVIDYAISIPGSPWRPKGASFLSRTTRLRSRPREVCPHPCKPFAPAFLWEHVFAAGRRCPAKLNSPAASMNGTLSATTACLLTAITACPSLLPTRRSA